MLYNSEVWHGITKQNIKDLELVDHYLLRSLLNAHSKVPIEYLYLETGTVPIQFLISSRRLMYLKTILMRSENELIRRVYMSQINNTVPGDWSQLMKEDMDMLSIDMNVEIISEMTISSYKSYIKQKVRDAAFRKLEEMKTKHSKIKDIHYTNILRPQEYLTGKVLSNIECSVLFSLRSKTVRGVKNNFRKMYNGYILCPLCGIEVDTQEHMLKCIVVKSIIPELNSSKVDMSQIYGSLSEQKEVTALVIRVIQVRDSLLPDDSQDKGLPGPYNTGPKPSRTK